MHLHISLNTVTEVVGYRKDEDAAQKTKSNKLAVQLLAYCLHDMAQTLVHALALRLCCAKLLPLPPQACQTPSRHRRGEASTQTGVLFGG